MTSRLSSKIAANVVGKMKESDRKLGLLKSSSFSREEPSDSEDNSGSMDPEDVDELLSQLQYTGQTGRNIGGITGNVLGSLAGLYGGMRYGHHKNYATTAANFAPLVGTLIGSGVGQIGGGAAGGAIDEALAKRKLRKELMSKTSDINFVAPEDEAELLRLNQKELGRAGGIAGGSGLGTLGAVGGLIAGAKKGAREGAKRGARYGGLRGAATYGLGFGTLGALTGGIGGKILGRTQANEATEHDVDEINDALEQQLEREYASRNLYSPENYGEDEDYGYSDKMSSITPKVIRKLAQAGLEQQEQQESSFWPVAKTLGAAAGGSVLGYGSGALYADRMAAKKLPQAYGAAMKAIVGNNVPHGAIALDALKNKIMRSGIKGALIGGAALGGGTLYHQLSKDRPGTQNFSPNQVQIPRSTASVQPQMQQQMG